MDNNEILSQDPKILQPLESLLFGDAKKMKAKVRDEMENREMQATETAMKDKGGSSEALNARLNDIQFDRITSSLETIVFKLTQIADSLEDLSSPIHTLVSQPQPIPSRQQQEQQQPLQYQEAEDSPRLKRVLARLEVAKKALIDLGSRHYSDTAKPEIDFSDPSYDPEFVAIWCRSINRHEYTMLLCNLVTKLGAEESEERLFLRGLMKHNI
ncbi:hypothetical protein BGZ46_008570 [Entomortierella lignicola]|nr:hypothetical protein BGZ46_008570 [Entomortierella lignicola]